MNPVEGALRRVDRFQQRHPWLGIPFAVVTKFGDDAGGALTTLLAYNAFFALFPALLVLVTLLGYVLGGDPELQRRVLDHLLTVYADGEGGFRPSPRARVRWPRWADVPALDALTAYLTR